MTFRGHYCYSSVLNQSRRGIPETHIGLTVSGVQREIEIERRKDDMHSPALHPVVLFTKLNTMNLGYFDPQKMFPCIKNN